MYGKLNELYQKNRLDLFVMAMSYIIDKGYSTVKEITDDDIATLKGNGLMTEDFCKVLVKLAREICLSADDGTELIQFADAKGLFETYYYTNGETYRRNMLESFVGLLLKYILYDEDIPAFNSIEEAKEDIAGYLGIEVEDVDKLLKY